MKKGKRIVGLALALTMAFSATAAAFAVSAAEEKEPAYTPTYNERVTEEKVAELVTMADGALDSLVWANYGSTVFAEVFGLLAGIGGDFATPEFWKSIDADLFKDLSGGINTETMKAYLAEHPVAVASANDLVANLEKYLPTALEGLLNMEISAGTTVVTILDKVASMAGASLEALDALIKIFGAECGDNNLVDILKSAKADPEQFAQDVTTYLMGIVKLIAPDTVNKLLGLIRTYSNNQAEILEATDYLCDRISSNVFGLSLALKNLIPEASSVLDQVKSTADWIRAALAANTIDGTEQAVDEEGNPVEDEEGNPVMEQVLDLDRVVNSILNGATGAFGGLVDIPDLSTFVAVVADGEESTAMIKLSSINELIASIADEGVDSSADVLMVAYNYLYDNIFANDSNYNMLKSALPMIPSLLESAGLDAETVEMITGMIPTISGLLDQLKAAGPLGTMETIMTLLGVLEEPVEPTDPTEPTTDAGDNTNPGTGDAMFAVVAGAGVLAAGAVLVLAKKREH